MKKLISILLALVLGLTACGVPSADPAGETVVFTDDCGRDVVIVARVRAAESTYQQLEKSFLYLARKLDLLKKDQEHA